MINLDLNEDEVRALKYAEKIITIFDKGNGVVKSIHNPSNAEAAHCAVILRNLNTRINNIIEERKKI